MRIPDKQLATIDSKAPTLGFKAPKTSLVAKMRRARSRVRVQISDHRQASFAVFEEAAKFVVAFEDFQFQREDRPKEVTPFIFMLARIRSDLLAVRGLLLDGQESAALAVARVFLEDMELTMATAVDSKFAIDFMEAEDSDSFWSRNVGYGKIYPYVEKFLHLGRQGKAISAEHIAQHKSMKTFLSRHIHPTFSSAVRLVIPPAIERPGFFANRPEGWFGDNSGKLCMYIAEEVQAFGATCISAIVNPNPPISLANCKPNKAFATFMRPAHNLQTLLSRYSRRIYTEYDKKSERWDAQMMSEI